MRNNLNLPGSVMIVAHTLFYGASDALADYLKRNKIATLEYLAHPFRKENPAVSYAVYKNGQRTHSHSTAVRNAGTMSAFAADMIRTLVTGVRLEKSADIYIGVNPLNALTGIFLRTLGKVKRVVFYAIDFTPKRYGAGLANMLYHAVESYAVRHSDAVWNVSPKIAEGRQKHLGIDPAQHPQTVVPIGVWNSEIVRNIKKTNGFRIVFVGHLLEKQGVQVVLEALPEVLKRFPEITFTVIGGGEYESTLRRMASSLKLDNHVRFLGWMADQENIRRELRRADLAVAVYSDKGDTETNFTYYADPTKIKTYASCGVPVVMTAVPYNAGELARAGQAFLVQYEPQSVSDMIISVFGNPEKLARAKTAALAYAKTMTWDRIFSAAFASL